VKLTLPRWKRRLFLLGLGLTLVSGTVIEVSFLLLLSSIPAGVLRVLVLAGTAGVIAGCTLLWLSRKDVA